MIRRLWPKKRWVRVVLLALAVLLLPYAFSRLASPWRCLSVHSSEHVDGRQTPASDKPFRIVCYNIAHGRGVAESNWDGGDRAERIARLDEIAGLLRTMHADVVVLNEVDFDSSWSYSTDQARYLAEKAGYPYWAEQRNLDFRFLTWTWSFGNAVLSKYPVRNAEVVDLPGYSTWETILVGKKRAVVCDLDIGDRTVRVIGAHLSHRSESLRASSANAIVEITAASPWPTIVAGDLNSTPPGFPKSVTGRDGNNAIATFDNSGHFRRSPTGQPLSREDLTYSSVEPRSVIDWILIPRDCRFVRYKVGLSRLSDHRPVSADVEFPPAKSGK